MPSLLATFHLLYFPVEPSGGRECPARVHCLQGEEARLQPDGQPGTTHQLQLTPTQYQGKRVVILLDLEVLQRGDAEGRKIGNPVPIGADGKVSFLLRVLTFCILE